MVKLWWSYTLYFTAARESVMVPVPTPWITLVL